MTLRVEFVSRLSDIITPAIEFLREPADLFEKQHIVVPTAGVKAWLMPEIAKKLGTSSPTTSDGVIANVEVDFPGSLTKFMKPQVKGERDPWLIENLTFHVLDVISADGRYEAVIKQSGGPLIAARAIADRFDRYHVRRPAMIRLWEQGKATVSPTAHNPNAKQLNTTDMWQFELWSAVRKRIGHPSPAAREPELSSQTPRRLLVIGFQTLSPGQIDALLQLKEHVELRVVLVHPSHAISQKWGVAVEPTIGLIPERNPTPSLPADVDSLVNSWLLGSKELEYLLASQQIEALHTPHSDFGSQDLLGRLQRTVTQQLVATRETVQSTDRSVAIHRCHNLSRQVEVLHDALLHAFTDMPDLQPHEVVVLCPNIEAAAPYMESTFARVLKIDGRNIKLPLVVADRGIRQVDEGAALLAGLLDLVQSRCSLDGVLSLATSDLILKNLGVNSEGVEHWYRYAEKANVRWGLTEEHRKRNGLHAPELSAHSWRNALEQMLLGALLPDGTGSFEAFGVDALDDVDMSDVDEIAALIQIFNAILALSDQTSEQHTVTDWCDLVESTMLLLCGENCDEIAVAVKQIGLLRSSAVGNLIDVPFADVARQLGDMMSQIPGRQPLRTGAITATSMIPLRGVPFRVVCVVGFDEESLSSSEGEGDDLVERQRLIGDQDTRLDVRRSLLDSALAAQDRLIITCTGQSIKNNQRLPLATPLAEFIDFTRRLGVENNPNNKNLSAIEVEHPRHATSVRNFFLDAVQPGIIWAHDDVARQAATTLGAPIAAAPLSAISPTDPITLTPEILETTYIEPIDLYIRQTLDMFIYRKNEKDTPATIPLNVDKKVAARLAKELLSVKTAQTSLSSETDWDNEVRRSGVIPPSPFGDEAFTELHELVDAMQSNLAANSIDFAALKSVDVEIDISDEVKLIGKIPLCTSGDQMTAVAVYFRAGSKEYEYIPALRRLAIRLLIARAAGIPIKTGYVLARHEKWSNDPSHIVRERSVVLDAAITQDDAIKRLGRLCDMARIALVSPCASFGKTASVDVDKMAYEFDVFVSSDEYHETEEFIIFGDNPQFEDVFHSKSPVTAFWKAHQGLFELPLKDSKKEYLVK